MRAFLLGETGRKATHEMNERQRTEKIYHLQAFDAERAAGFYELPVLHRCGVIPERLIGFHEAMGRRKDCGAGVHFYLDDYQFERFWRRPDTYIPILARFQCVLTPDFSLYMDMPMAMKIWNVYRSRLLGQMMQDAGLAVIPSITWAEEETFSFCFDGIEPGGAVSVSSVGVKKSRGALTLWRAGFEEAVRRLTPSCVVLYGEDVQDIPYDGKIVNIRNSVTERLRRVTYGRTGRIQRDER